VKYDSRNYSDILIFVFSTSFHHSFCFSHAIDSTNCFWFTEFSYHGLISYNNWITSTCSSDSPNSQICKPNLSKFPFLFLNQNSLLKPIFKINSFPFIQSKLFPVYQSDYRRYVGTTSVSSSTAGPIFILPCL
jgi:hypothetical protein